MPFIPHTEADIAEMLKVIQAQDLNQLFEEIPVSLQHEQALEVLPACTEMEISKYLQKRAEEDAGYLSFLGAGAYEHHIPAAVWALVSRGEFLTAYTPYQAEASQGSLQVIYEYQTMMASLTGMEVSNASLYDGASALAEAVLMAVRLRKYPRVIYAGSLHPLYLETVKTIVGFQNIELLEWPLDLQTGLLDPVAQENFKNVDFSALIIQQPNFFGGLEAVDELVDWAHAREALALASVNPISLALLKPPGDWGKEGADIVCGEGQPLGVPLASGGPYFGFMTTKMEYIRQMPGRIVGRTTDEQGRTGFTLTLQAREQHIRRAKAKSNICTNQGLLVTAATIYMSLLGPQGLRQVALSSHQAACELFAKLRTLPGVEALWPGPFFHEFVLKFNQPVLAELLKKKIIGGLEVSLYFPALKNCVLINATEMKTEEEMEIYKGALLEILNPHPTLSRKRERG